MELGGGGGNGGIEVDWCTLGDPATPEVVLNDRMMTEAAPPIKQEHSYSLGVGAHHHHTPEIFISGTEDRRFPSIDVESMGKYVSFFRNCETSSHSEGQESERKRTKMPGGHFTIDGAEREGLKEKKVLPLTMGSLSVLVIDEGWGRKKTLGSLFPSEICLPRQRSSSHVIVSHANVIFWVLVLFRFVPEHPCCVSQPSKFRSLK